VLNRSQWSASLSGHFIGGQITRNTHYKEGYVGPKNSPHTLNMEVVLPSETTRCHKT